MNCNDVARLLSEQRDGLDISDRMTEVSAHLSFCVACQAIEREDALIGDLLKPLGETPLAAGRARAAIDQWRPQGRGWARPWVLRPALVLIPVACAATVVVFLRPSSQPGAAAKRGEPKVEHVASFNTPSSPSEKEPKGGTRGGTAARPGGKKAPAVKNVRKQPHFEHLDIEKRVPIRKMDDIAYVTRGVEASMSRWAQLPADVAERIRRDTDKTIKTGDKFIDVPFPRVVNLNPAGLAAAKREYQREKEVIDPRLTRKVSLAAKGISFADLCTQWTAQTGIEFSAGKTVMDDKATLFCKDRPLRDIMRQITQVFGFLWRRSGEPGRYQYELYQDMRSQLLEEELRNKDRNEALVALDKEMQRYAKYAHLTPEQAKAMAETASPEDKELLKNLAGPGWPGARLYSSLSPDQMAALRTGEEIRFSANPEPGQYALPADMHTGILQSMHRARIKTDESGRVRGLSFGGDNGPPGPGEQQPVDFPSSRTHANLQLRFNELGQIEMVGGGGFFIQVGDKPEAGVGGSNSDILAAGISPSVKEPHNKEANAKLASDAGMRAVVNIEPKPSCNLQTHLYNPRSASGARATTADVWAAVHEATGADIVADSFTKLYTPAEVTVTNSTLFDALNKLCDHMRVKWSKQEGWLQFRSTSFFNDRLKEVPNRLFEKWAASRKRSGQLSKEDLMEIAQLTDAQLDAKATDEAARAIYGLHDWYMASSANARSGWRFLASLSPQLQKAAWGEQGLGFRQLPVSLQQKFAALVFNSARDRSRANMEDVANASMRVEMIAPREGSADGKQRPEFADVKFIYRYGGGGLDRTRKEIGSLSMMVGPDQERAAGTK
jgi:hypothetical protein